ncbi:MAG: GGDEF domain-containing protein, partial [Atopobiaceae bacterium]|nr:GGDEF domain-containing protein [Atopobiaceae bacterium]
MDTSTYGTEIDQLIAEMNQYLDAYDARVFGVLEKLESAALPRKDHGLLGLIYHNFAGAHYDHNNHDQVFVYIEKALSELLRSDNRELIARTYNLFAIEAQRFGSLSTAYYYYDFAYTFLHDTHAPLLRAIIRSNTGDLLNDLGNPKEACNFIREALELLDSMQDEDTAISRLFTASNLASKCVHAGDIEEAKEIQRQIDEQIDQNDIEVDSIARSWIMLSKACIAAADQDDVQTQACVSKIIDEIVCNQLFPFYIKDVCQYIQLLIHERYWKLAGQLIEAVEHNMPAGTPEHTEMILSEMKIQYFGAIGEKDKLLKSYSRRFDLIGEQQVTQNKVNQSSIRLMKLLSNMRNEIKEQEQENERLQVIAETDALVQLPNRRALNRYIDEAFERATAQGHSFGVGIVDIDKFKHYNDEYGHLEGDECLRKVSHALDAIAKKHKLFLARYGGDEFMFVYEGLSQEDVNAIDAEIQEISPINVTHGFYNTTNHEGM